MFKPLALVLLLSVAALPARAQSAPPVGAAATPVNYQYCNLCGYGTQGRSPYLEYGQSANPAAVNPELEARNYEIKKLDSIILGLNYMTSHGWEYVGVTSLSFANSGYLVYILRRPTQ